MLPDTMSSCCLFTATVDVTTRQRRLAWVGESTSFSIVNQFVFKFLFKQYAQHALVVEITIINHKYVAAVCSERSPERRGYPGREAHQLRHSVPRRVVQGTEGGQVAKVCIPTHCYIFLACRV